MAKYGMAINLDDCVGCGACALACKTENNTSFEKNSKQYNWADYLTFTEGSFKNGDVSFEVIPVLCNHCTDAPCVEICPVTPKAMFKTADGMTMHNQERCIGCRLCQDKCPYSLRDVDSGNVQYSVISYNPNSEPTHSFYADETAIIPNGTSTPKEIATATGFIPPEKHEYTHTDYSAVRAPNKVEKCIFCDHRVLTGEDPYCVVSCPTGARIFGDLNDGDSDISKAIVTGFSRLKDNSGDYLGNGEKGTDPNVYYIGEGLATGIVKRKIEAPVELLTVYPNPASSHTNIEFSLKKASDVTIDVFNIGGKRIKSLIKNHPYQSGKNSIEMQLSDLGTGTYIIRLSYDKTVSTINLVVSR
ncbi:MAG TPA: 4Fe-4S dicluster domain-containing protein [Bacteroides sp.]|nr:4Fe-4S dicluster domain-containing protein [Bacteroides sp.]